MPPCHVPHLTQTHRTPGSLLGNSQGNLRKRALQEKWKSNQQRREEFSYM